MGFALGSQELAEEIMRKQDEDPEFREKIKGLTARLLMVAEDCPGNEDRQMAIDWEDGRFNEIVITKKPAPSDLRTAPFDHTRYDFRVVAPQNTYIDMINGKMNMLEAMSQVKIDGDFAKLMASAQAFMGFIEYLVNLGIEP